MSVRLSDFLRVLSRRRRVALPAALFVFLSGTVGVCKTSDGRGDGDRVAAGVSMAAAGGALAGAAIAFLLERLDRRFGSAAEIESALHLHCLGAIPLAARAEASQPLADPPPAGDRAAMAAAVGQIVIAIGAATGDVRAPVLVVTSAGADEGKSVVSAHLAAAFARTGRRTLVIDADLRRPRLHELLDLTRGPGVSDVVLAGAPIAGTVRASRLPNLSVLSAGPAPADPADVLGSAEWLRVIDELHADHEWVVVDAPPIMPVVDAAILARASGDVVLVVAADRTPRRRVREAVARLRRADARILGVVLNRVEAPRGHDRRGGRS